MLSFNDYMVIYELDLEDAWLSEDSGMSWDEYRRAMFQEYSMAEEQALIEQWEHANAASY